MRDKIQIRKMKPGEAKEVKALGHRTFTFLESLFLSLPAEALVAEQDNKIVGAVTYKIFRQGKWSLAYVDYAFVDPEYQGKGIGKQLITKNIERLRALGVDHICTIVKDDNVASWKLFIANGLLRVDVFALVRQLGIGSALKIIFRTPFLFATGMEWYLSSKNQFEPPKTLSLHQICWYLLLNSLILAFSFWRVDSFPAYLSALLLVLIGLAFSGHIGTFFSKETWKFRVTEGGVGTSFIVYLMGGIFPLVGKWYPKNYKKQKSALRALALPSIFQWLLLLAIGVATSTFFTEANLFQYLQIITSSFLIFFSLPFYPFGSFGGIRVYRWSKLMHFILVGLSFFVVFML